MSAITAMEEAFAPMDAARRFFEAARTGRAVDALDLFATDGEVRDAEAGEHRGIRAVAAFVARNRSPTRVDVDDLREEGDRVVATVRIERAGGSRRLRYAFTFRGGRIASLRIDAVSGDRPASRRAPASATHA